LFFRNVHVTSVTNELETSVCGFDLVWLIYFWACFIGDGLYWKAEENDIQMENLRKELQEKDETIKALKSQLLAMEKEKYKKEMEFDLLRQSLRIMNGKKSSIQTKESLLRSKLGK